MWNQQMGLVAAAAAVVAAVVDTAALDFQSRMGPVRRLQTPQNRIELEQQELVRHLRNHQIQIEELEPHQSQIEELERHLQSRQRGLERQHQSQSLQELPEPGYYQKLALEHCHRRKILLHLLEQLRYSLPEPSMRIHQRKIRLRHLLLELLLEHQN
jgi:TolA-binding protein